MRETDPIDMYVVDVSFEREGVTQFNPEEQHLVSFLAKVVASEYCRSTTAWRRSNRLHG